MENPILFLLRKSGVHFPKALLGNYARPDFAELDVFLGQHTLLDFLLYFCGNLLAALLPVSYCNCPFTVL